MNTMNTTPQTTRKLIDYTQRRSDQNAKTTSRRTTVTTAQQKQQPSNSRRRSYGNAIPSFLYLNEPRSYNLDASEEDDESLVEFFLKVDPSKRRSSSASIEQSSQHISLSDIIHGEEPKVVARQA